MTLILEKKLASGHMVEYSSEEKDKAYGELFHGNKDLRMIKLRPGGLFVPETFPAFADKYYTFQFKPTDVILMTFPKCGTTWAQDILWTMLHNKNLDNVDANQGLNLRSPTLEIDAMIPDGQLDPIIKQEILEYASRICPNLNPEERIFLQLAEQTPSPSIIKTHLPFSMLNPNLIDTCKVVHVLREPKDCCTSLLHFCRLNTLHDFVGTNDQFVDYFIANEVHLCPYWGLAKSAWEKRNHPNLLILYYEDMKENIIREVKRMDAFLQTKLTDIQIQNICDYTSFEQMKKRNNHLTSDDSKLSIFKEEIAKKSGGFFRKGIVGDSKNVLSPRKIRALDDWISENTTDMPGFRYAPE